LAGRINTQFTDHYESDKTRSSRSIGTSNEASLVAFATRLANSESLQ